MEKENTVILDENKAQSLLFSFNIREADIWLIKWTHTEREPDPEHTNKIPHETQIMKMTEVGELALLDRDLMNQKYLRAKFFIGNMKMYQ